MKTIIEEAVDNIDLMVKQLHKQINLYHDLQKLLLLADLLEVPPKEIKKPVRYKIYGAPTSFQKPWVGMIFTVRVGDGPYEDFALIDVDKRLWPDDMRQAHDNWCKREAKRRKQHGTLR